MTLRTRRVPWILALVLLASIALAVVGQQTQAQEAPATDTLGKSTVEQTIAGGNRSGGAFGALTLGPGEPYVVREEQLGVARPGRERRRRSLAYFAQLTDFQLSDEESPSRVEFLDSSADEPLNSPFGAAFRPQEALVPHMTEESIRQVNAFSDASPVTQGDGSRSKLGFSITTGDSADSQQRNEVDAVVSLLEGSKVVTNSGSSNPADYARCPPGTPGPEEGARYTGVQDYDDVLAGSAFYDPDEPAGQFGRFPRYPGLMDRAQTPFQATGLGVPSYVTFGNHDGLVQGNQAASAPIEEVATGCVKVTAPVPGFDPLSAAASPSILLGSFPNRVALVPPDETRQYVSKPQYKELHRTGRQPDAHGFGFVDAEEEKGSKGAAGYYAFDPAPGFRFIGLDTVSEGGVAGPSALGNLDDPQFRWLERELATAQKDGKLVVLFGHHPVRSLSSPVPDEVAPPCTSPDEHGHDRNPGCDLDPRRSTPIHLGGELEALMRKTPNVIAHVSGHTHENRVAPVRREGGGGFWAIETAAEIDFPHQNRLLEVMDNRDGTLSIFGTVLDNAAPVTAPPPETPAIGFDVATLASIGRLIGYNDPQSATTADNGQLGAGGLGRVNDRNVELLLQDPRAMGGDGAAAAPPAPTATPAPTAAAKPGGKRAKPKPRPRTRRRTDGAGDRSESRETGAATGGSLPFTGMHVGGVAAGGLFLLSTGLMLRRRRFGARG